MNDPTGRITDRVGSRTGQPRVLPKTRFSDRWNSAIGTTIVRCVGLATNFGALALIGRTGGSEMLGVVVALSGTSFVVANCFSLGLPTYILRAVTDHLATEDRASSRAEFSRGMRLTAAACFCGAIAIGLLVCAMRWGPLPKRFGAMGLSEWLGLGASAWAMAFQFNAISLLRALRSPAVSAFFQFCTFPLILLACVEAAKYGGASMSQGTGVVLFTITAWANSMFTYFASLRLLHASNRSPSPHLKALPRVELRGMWYLSVLSSASANVPVMIGALLLPASEVAILGVPFRICNLPMTIVAALGAYYSPRIRQAYIQNRPADQGRELRESQWMGCLLVLPVIAASFLAPNLTLRLFGIESQTATAVLKIFAVAQVAIASCGVCEQYLVMVERTKFALNVTFWFLATSLAAAFLCGAKFGALALAVAWSISAVSKQGVLWYGCGGEPRWYRKFLST